MSPFCVKNRPVSGAGLKKSGKSGKDTHFLAGPAKENRGVQEGKRDEVRVRTREVEDEQVGSKEDHRPVSLLTLVRLDPDGENDPQRSERCCQPVEDLLPASQCPFAVRDRIPNYDRSSFGKHDDRPEEHDRVNGDRQDVGREEGSLDRGGDERASDRAAGGRQKVRGEVATEPG